MNRIKKILHHKIYLDCLQKLKEFEKDREFCKHTLEHFIDVARIMYIMALENDDNIDKELIYAAGLLHDVGRVKEYENGTPHNIAGLDIIRKIMNDAGFYENEINQVLNAVENHRDENGGRDLLSKYLYEADKKSRNCFCCMAYDKCKWSEEEKNRSITK
ncbi:hypothetical protein Cst_c07300 [Thermoclostridium stercorarium subsp. stercorarium DSM 8532]|jgi:putative nucleotidyltransferase with HDIG domain|uniref:HD domain-containing protein n=3 Tax=Thermoclostridium stercorarium TaxID=1510 RepID=L7VI67_THES1|nr:HD domain-containing protein [Thermoclostridium stercorarium]AGC67735.1 hypothetical protein Cst_c07300 [Thermoclostridium stercorarium subsp. stercorarium DSM 8532]AGI38787.1 hypothetical protein Clst_0697 [Thermoclostridium stercorarium subsp. stercorarium DSM 8532]ANW98149.1 hypothetical protein CSTERTH_03380 [Thermoclostridium stercorarium subsp. thermolacticum DSM 2910]ANX00688.1 hypothetical protein CSTERLE_03320 [Thermoclostridium stercorarium subsp. leptospartum DSM 9219]UZQ86303.1 